jgi:beta-lactamase class A
MKPRTPHTRRAPDNSRQTFSATYRPMATTSHGQIPTPVLRRIPLKIKLLACALLVIFIGGHVVWTQHVSAEALAQRHVEQALAAEAARKSAHFSEEVTALISAHPELSMSVVAAPHESRLVQLGALETFDAASTAKLLTATDYLHHVARGQATLNTVIDGQTADYWLKIMIINSDDTAWTALNNYLGHDDLRAYAKSIGITDYAPETNSLSARDITNILQKLYDFKLLNSSNRALLLSFMSQANFREFTVAAVPASMKVYHKIGIDDDSVHDALIIANGSKSICLTIFTNGHGTYNWDERKTLMQTITRDAVAAYL